MTEAIIAVVLLAVAIPPMLWTLREHHVQRINPMLVSQARWLAVEKLEDVIADRHSPQRGYDYLAQVNYPDEASVAGFPAFSRRVRFIETGPDLQTSGEGYMTVTVTVQWRDATGQSRELSIATVLTELPS